jgi:phenylacetaldehyde dehydrogenase
MTSITRASYDVTDPYTERVIGSAPENTPDDAVAAVARAHAAFPGWAATDVLDRAAILHAAAAEIARRSSELIELVQAETGGTTPYVTTTQVGEASARLARFAEMGVAAHDDALGAVGDGTGRVDAAVIRRPLGVTACITPYNVPLIGITGKIGPALITGNTVVIKPAVQSPLSALLLQEILDGAGFPAGVVTMITGTDPDTSRALVAAPEVAMISFTGSTRVGADIARTASPRFARLLLELGGKGAAVVFGDADIDRAVSAISSIFTRYSGQVCTAPSRLLVERSRYDEVVERLGALADELVIGDPRDPATVIGPVISAPHRERVEGMIERAVADGATRVSGAGRTLPDRGHFVAPTVLSGATPGSEIMQEEVFGPVVAAAPFDSIDEATALVNGTRYGLTNYVWAGDPERGRDFARTLRSGTVSVNTAVSRHPGAPFGGVGESGIGREGGRFSLDAYTEPASIIWGAS